MKVAVTLIFAASAFAAMAQVANPAGFDELAARAAAALERNPQQAAELYAQAVAIRPSWAEGWFYLGASKYQLKQYAEAGAALERATALAPDNGGAWAFLGLTEYERADFAHATMHILKAEALGLPDNPQFVEVVRL